MKILKRNGAEAVFDIEKIVMAVTKANEAAEEKVRMTPLQIRRICSGVIRTASSAASLALVTAMTIFSMSKTASAPLRLIIFIGFSSLGRKMLQVVRAGPIIQDIVVLSSPRHKIQYLPFYAEKVSFWEWWKFGRGIDKSISFFRFSRKKGLKLGKDYSIISETAFT